MWPAVRTVRQIEHHDDVSAGIFVNKFLDQRPREWTKHKSHTLEVATKAFMVEVNADSHF